MLLNKKNALFEPSDALWTESARQSAMDNSMDVALVFLPHLVFKNIKFDVHYKCTLQLSTLFHRGRLGKQNEKLCSVCPHSSSLFR